MNPTTYNFARNFLNCIMEHNENWRKSEHSYFLLDTVENLSPEIRKCIQKIFSTEYPTLRRRFRELLPNISSTTNYTSALSKLENSVTTFEKFVDFCLDVSLFTYYVYQEFSIDYSRLAVDSIANKLDLILVGGEAYRDIWRVEVKNYLLDITTKH